MSGGGATAHDERPAGAVRPFALLGFASTLLRETVAFRFLFAEHAAGFLLDVADGLVRHALDLAAGVSALIGAVIYG